MEEPDQPESEQHASVMNQRSTYLMDSQAAAKDHNGMQQEAYEEKEDRQMQIDSKFLKKLSEISPIKSGGQANETPTQKSGLGSEISEPKSESNISTPDLEKLSNDGAPVNCFSSEPMG